MNIRLLRIYSLPISISSQELHVSDTCFLHELHIMERYVTTTYRLHELHELHINTRWIRNYCVSSIKYDALNV